MYLNVSMLPTVIYSPSSKIMLSSYQSKTVIFGKLRSRWNWRRI